MIGVINFPSSNAKSILNAFQILGINASLISTEAEINKSKAFVIPGVGNYISLLKDLEISGLDKVIIDNYRSNKKILGICLGMQILGKSSEEAPNSGGLGIFDYSTVKLNNRSLRVPQIGWNRIEIINDHPILNNLGKTPCFYFANSFGVLENSSFIIATYSYDKKMSAVVCKGNVVGVQFHPEKSQNTGLKLLSNFADWCDEF